MSVDNSELLMLLGGKKSKSTIGKAGQQGFGVGVYGGSPSDLKAMGLTPMEGCEDPTSDNYGNYIHTNGSVMVFIPAFAIRIGNASAPLYSKYGADTIEIGDVELAGKDGWAILRGFYDGGKLHSGFFIDKYLCSQDSTGKLAVSVKDGSPLRTSSSSESWNMPGCIGENYDAITLSRARGEQYALMSCYQWAIISLISLAHAQAATSAEACAWYDAKGLKNYPKGCNTKKKENSSINLRDVDDNSISFIYSRSWDGAKTGSAVPLEKTTHNGQLNGICDVNGNKYQSLLGCNAPTVSLFKMAKLSVKMHDFTKDNIEKASLFDNYTLTWSKEAGSYYWGSPALYTPDDTNFPLCGVIPKTLANYSSSPNIFGKDVVEVWEYDNTEGLRTSGNYQSDERAGICQRKHIYWGSGYTEHSLRVAGYAN